MAPARRAQPELAGLERDVTTVMKRYNARVTALEEAQAERDRVLRDALEGGIPRARLVELTALSPQRLDQIRRGARL